MEVWMDKIYKYNDLEYLGSNPKADTSYFFVIL
jgi:hypothetical protein